MVRVVDASGVDVVLVETVGVGQDELEITRTAHTTVVVMAPGLGDEVQAIKAGLLECADVFCVNKADREGADATVRDLQLMIALGSDALLALSKTKGHRTHTAADGHVTGKSEGDDERWMPPIVKAVATRNEGVEELVQVLGRHHAWVENTERGRARRQARLAEEVRDGLREALIEVAEHALGAQIDEAVRAVDAKEIDPYTATERLVAAFRGR
jgi:LAO/AO transport system kinase